MGVERTGKEQPRTGDRIQVGDNEYEVVIDELTYKRFISESAAEIIKRHKDDSIVLIGLAQGGLNLQTHLGNEIARQNPNISVESGIMIVENYKPDNSMYTEPQVKYTHIPGGLRNKVGILIECITDSGRTLDVAKKSIIRQAEDNLEMMPDQLELFALIIKEGNQTCELELSYPSFTVPKEPWYFGLGEDGNQALRYPPYFMRQV